MMEEPIKSRPYGAAPQACERCVFGRGVHAEFCSYASKTNAKRLRALLAAADRNSKVVAAMPGWKKGSPTNERK